MKTIIPEGYQSKLNIYETQIAIGELKTIFARNLSKELNLKRVSAPLFVVKETGLNDDLNGVERPVSFDIKNVDKHAQIVHSLAKWKRYALWQYKFNVGEGLYTDMNAIRRDEDMDNLHSIYVDQWDWEKVISRENRNVEYLKDTVRHICHAINETNDELKKEFKKLSFDFKDDPYFIDTYQLEELYPNETPKIREYLITKEHKTVFLMKIGCALKNGKPHDGRAPDYDDWQLNGDIIVYNSVLDCAFEVSSMGIRVDEKSLVSQLKERGALDRLNYTFHKMLVEGTLPLTIGGGIGQSRLSMLLLQKAHIGEVQVSIWDDETIEACKKGKIELL